MLIAELEAIWRGSAKLQRGSSRETAKIRLLGYMWSAPVIL